MVKAEAEAKAWEEYNQYVGKVIMVHELDGYTEKDDSETLHFDKPVRVSVEKTADDCIIRWMDEWLDPVWEITPIDPVPLRSCWIYATSYHLDGRTEGEGMVEGEVSDG